MHSNFSNFSCMFLNPNFFSHLNYNCPNLLEMKNFQEQVEKAFYFKIFLHVKKAFCYQKLFSARIDCSSDLKNFANFWPSASNVKSFSRSLEYFFLIVGQNNFGNKIPFLSWTRKKWKCGTSPFAPADFEAFSTKCTPWFLGTELSFIERTGPADPNSYYASV